MPQKAGFFLLTRAVFIKRRVEGVEVFGIKLVGDDAECLTEITDLNGKIDRFLF